MKHSYDEDDTEKRLGFFSCGEGVLGTKRMAWKRAAMVNPKNCKPMLERILGINIASVEVDREKSMIYHPEYKGIPMDKWVHFAIEADDCEMFLKNILKENTNI